VHLGKAPLPALPRAPPLDGAAAGTKCTRGARLGALTLHLGRGRPAQHGAIRAPARALRCGRCVERVHRRRSPP
jgi:hypothetical protein